MALLNHFSLQAYLHLGGLQRTLALVRLRFGALEFHLGGDFIVAHDERDVARLVHGGEIGEL